MRILYQLINSPARCYRRLFALNKYRIKSNPNFLKRYESTENLSAVLYEKEDLRLEECPIPKINKDEVLLRMDCVGICGSDVHYYVHGRIAHFIVEEPMVIGHEGSGIVHKVGAAVKHLKVGDRVAIEPGIPCRLCEFCRHGKYHLCPKIAFCATPPIDGNLAHYYKHAGDFCFKLPDHVTMEQGALLEPLSVGVHACRRAQIGLGAEVLILGAGPIGLVTIATAKAMGATKIMVTDLNEKRLEVAEEMGATHIVLSDDRTRNIECLAKKIQKCFGSEPNITIDCVGSEMTARLGVLATRSGGCCVMVGMAGDEITLPMFNALSREVDIRGSFRYVNTYPAALELVATGRVQIEKIITHHFDIEQTLEAFETAREGCDNAIKVMIHVQPQDTNNNIDEKQKKKPEENKCPPKK